MSAGGRNVLILGAGLVSRPIVRFFLERDGYRVTVGSLWPEDADALIEGHPRGSARQVDVADPAQCGALVRDAHVVISLVPYAHHPAVARCAIRHGVPMVTASYVLPEMRALDAEARSAGLTILNEIGLDPGLDHMSAMRLIQAARADGGQIVEFTSCCGGLPAPEAADNPWRYKFSWSPRGALLAGRLSARYLEHGRVVSVPGDRLFAHRAAYEVEELGGFEVYPNRDSLRYIEPYGLGEVRTMMRGTLRYPGWSETMQAIAELGLLDVEPRSWPRGTTYAAFLEGFLPAGTEPLARRLAARLSLAPDHPIVARIAWTGLLADEPLPETEASPLDVLARLFERRMAYAPGERDMVVLRHELRVRHEGRPDERRVSLLVAYGDPAGDSATSRTVSLPAAVAARLIADGDLRLPGVHIPTAPAIYEPILAELEGLGIRFREWSEPVEAPGGSPG